MTKFYEEEMDTQGNYIYKYFDDYFIESKRKALFIKYSGKLVGFIMINNYSYIGQKPDYVLAEFPIFPSFRKRGIAQQAINLVFTQYPGKWELKFNLKNKSAMRFWLKSTKVFKPKVYKLEDNEQVLTFRT